MQSIKLYILLLLCICLSPLQSSNFKGSRGEYYIQGIAYNTEFQSETKRLTYFITEQTKKLLQTLKENLK